MSVAYVQVNFRLYFIKEANTMNPDQTALKRSSLICVHTVCNIVYLEHMYMIEQATNRGRKWVNTQTAIEYRTGSQPIIAFLMQRLLSFPAFPSRCYGAGNQYILL